MKPAQFAQVSYFVLFWRVNSKNILGCMSQSESVTCLTADTCLTANPGVASSILARSHTFVAIDHEKISTAILFPFADSRRVVVSCCQLKAKVCA